MTYRHIYYLVCLPSSHGLYENYLRHVDLLHIPKPRLKVETIMQVNPFHTTEIKCHSTWEPLMRVLGCSLT